jgi:hypothetical protein
MRYCRLPENLKSLAHSPVFSFATIGNIQGISTSHQNCEGRSPDI